MSPVSERWKRASSDVRSSGQGAEEESGVRQHDIFAKILGIALIGTLIDYAFPFPDFRSLALAGICIVAIVSYISLARRGRFSLGDQAVGDDRYQALSEAVGQLVMHHAGNGHVLSVSGDARELFDIEPAALRGEGFFGRIHVADRLAVLQAIDSVRRGGAATPTAFRLRAGDVGSLGASSEGLRFTWAETRFCRLPKRGRGSTGAESESFVSVTRNITDVKDAERRLEKARAEAQIAISLKDRLLANVSHELRTPLNAILGFSEILGNPDLAPCDASKRIEYARIIYSSAEHLLSVVNLVLDMSRIEAGKFEITPEPFELEPLIGNCCDMLRLKAESGNVALAKSPMTGSVEIVADKRACRQILLNLMSNAVKFTRPGGSVEVGARFVAGGVHIHVVDTGIGIASVDFPRLGSPFFQVRSGYDRAFEGAGLGLSLVRGLVGLHGGSVLLESAVGVGTRVTVRLPFDCREAPRAGVGAPQLETAALSRFSPSLTAPEPDAAIQHGVVEERKIA